MIAIAIDGPAGAGKSTIAKRVAAQIGFIYVDTGALYRAIGYYALSKGADCQNPEEIGALLPSVTVELAFVDGVQRVILNGQDVSDSIRTPEVSMAASDVSAIPAVRTFLFDLQQDMARKQNVIMDGRDIGTVVLPHAQIKIFLTASPEERANRRYAELIEKGQTVNYDDILSDIIKRDYNDSHREIAPLKPAPDSVTVDTTGFALEQSVKALSDLINERLSTIEK